ncbi:MAG TPA: DNA methyltransferase [Tepidisphaeraceae bacterium]|jgi:hypothetical protein|nr:DNA methyltransferase [Tepidisphaeraceae bacterium]
MFPETFAEQWIDRLTKVGQTVLDPFSGRGTTACQAVLMERRAVACDVNDVAYCLTKAKVCAPSESIVFDRLRATKHKYRSTRWTNRAKECPEFFKHAFAESTLAQLLFLREALEWRTRRSDAMLAALVLGALHGDNTPRYLSNQMPRTISTKPRYSVNFWKKRGMAPPERDVFDVVEHYIAFRYESERPRGDALILHTDMRDLPRKVDPVKYPVRCVITSPPYFDVTNFEEDQWLRLWFLGGPPMPSAGRLSRDDRYSFEPKYWSFIADMWRSIAGFAQKNTDVIIRIGSSRIEPEHLSRLLHLSARVTNRKVRLVSKDVSELQRRQTDAFRPGTVGCRVEVDCHFNIA